jgi:hypothetical protein
MGKLMRSGGYMGRTVFVRFVIPTLKIKTIFLLNFAFIAKT